MSDKHFGNNSIDINRLEEINQLQNKIFSSDLTTSQNSNQAIKQKRTSSNSNSNKLIEHANFYHSFAEKNVKAMNIVPLYFTIHHDTEGDSTNLPSIVNPIITDIKEIDQDSVEITRIHLYENFYNKAPYSTEKIIVKRNVQNNKDDVLTSYYEDKFKKGITSLTADGSLTKIIKFKIFRDAKEVLFYQNIFYYRCILETYAYYKKLNKVSDKKEFSIHNMSYHEFIKNLF